MSPLKEDRTRITFGDRPFGPRSSTDSTDFHGFFLLKKSVLICLIRLIRGLSCLERHVVGAIYLMRLPLFSSDI